MRGVGTSAVCGRGKKHTVVDSTGFYKRGQYWYKLPHGSDPYEPRRCKGCGEVKLIRRTGGTGEYCSHRCAARTLRGTDDPTYSALHVRTKVERGRASVCIWGCESSKYEWAHNQGEVGNPDEYFSMCKRCHARFDQAIRSMQEDYVPFGKHVILTPDLVREARVRHSAGETAKALAAEFGVKYQTLWKAITGRNWRHLL